LDLIYNRHIHHASHAGHLGGACRVGSTHLPPLLPRHKVAGQAPTGQLVVDLPCQQAQRAAVQASRSGAQVLQGLVGLAAVGGPGSEQAGVGRRAPSDMFTPPSTTGTADQAARQAEPS
jgi:hypothetical protein